MHGAELEEVKGEPGHVLSAQVSSVFVEEEQQEVERFYAHRDNMENYLMSHLEGSPSENEERQSFFEEAITKKGISMEDLFNPLSKLKGLEDRSASVEQDNIYRRPSILLQSFYDDISSQVA